MQAPMILPWVARKAGISPELALKLWRRAASETELRLGTCQSPDYHRLAAERFLSLAEDESCAPACQPAGHITWICRHHRRLFRLSIIAAQQTWNDWNGLWQDYYLGRKAA